MLDLSGLKQTLSNPHITSHTLCTQEDNYWKTLYMTRRALSVQRESTAHGFRATQLDLGSRFDTFS